MLSDVEPAIVYEVDVYSAVMTPAASPFLAWLNVILRQAKYSMREFDMT